MCHYILECFMQIQCKVFSLLTTHLPSSHTGLCEEKRRKREANRMLVIIDDDKEERSLEELKPSRKSSWRRLHFRWILTKSKGVWVREIHTQQESGKVHLLALG